MCKIKFHKKDSKSAGGPINTSQKYELTNWQRVEAFTERFIEKVKIKSQDSPPKGLSI